MNDVRDEQEDEEIDDTSHTIQHADGARRHFDPADGNSGSTRHEYDYTVVPLTTGRLAISGPAGESTASLVAGEPYFRTAGVEHDVRNANAFEFAFVEIELKAP